MNVIASGPLATRTQLVSTRSLTNSEAVLEALMREGVRGAEGAVLELERGWPMPKVPLMLRFRNTEASGKSRRWWTLHFVDGSCLPYPLRMGIKQRRATYLRELRAVVQIFPEDVVLEGVGDAVRAATALPLISEALPPEKGSWEALTARLLTYKPTRRLTVKYRLHRSSGRGTTVFGKCFPPGVDGAMVTTTLALNEAAQRKGLETLRLPRLAGRVREWNMLLWKRQSGVSVYDLLGSEQASEAVWLSGRCLAELQTSSVAWQRIHDRFREVGTLRSWVRAVATADLVRGGSLYRTLQQLTDWQPRAGTVVPSHRDFYDKQLLIDGRQGSLLDLETSSRAEPELDIANFLAHLKLRALQGRRLDTEGLERGFLDGYLGRQNRPSRARLDWYLASSLLRLACVYFFRWHSLELSDRLQSAALQVMAETRRTMN